MMCGSTLLVLLRNSESIKKIVIEVFQILAIWYKTWSLHAYKGNKTCDIRLVRGGFPTYLPR
jgi:hypothetical protein